MLMVMYYSSRMISFLKWFFSFHVEEDSQPEVACLFLISLSKFWKLSNKKKHNIWSQQAYILNYLTDVSINFTFLHQGILWPAEVVNITLDVSSIWNHPELLFSLASKPQYNPPLIPSQSPFELCLTLLAIQFSRLSSPLFSSSPLLWTVSAMSSVPTSAQMTWQLDLSLVQDASPNCRSH